MNLNVASFKNLVMIKKSLILLLLHTIFLYFLQSDRLKGELEIIRVKYHQANEELANLRMNLDDSRSNADRLHKESELVVHNVNTWVKEQK